MSSDYKLSEDKQCLKLPCIPLRGNKAQGTLAIKRAGATALGPVGEWLSHIPFTDGIVGSNPIGTIMGEKRMMDEFKNELVLAIEDAESLLTKATATNGFFA